MVKTGVCDFVVNDLQNLCYCLIDVGFKKVQSVKSHGIYCYLWQIKPLYGLTNFSDLKANVLTKYVNIPTLFRFLFDDWVKGGKSNI